MISSFRHQPREVVTAVKLLYLTLFIGLTQILAQIFFFDVFAKVPFSTELLPLFLSVILILIWWELILQTKRGHNWARIAIAAIVVTNAALAFGRVPLYIYFLQHMAGGAVGLMLGGIIVILSTVAIGLLFQHQSNEWFREVWSHG
jgi:hypothetical protein